MQDKNEKMGHVSYLVIKHLLKVQSPKLNVKTLSEAASVSRPWVYKYFGSTEHDIIMTAIDCLAPQITELSSPLDDNSTRKEWARNFLKGLEKTLIESEQYPEFFQFYFMHMIFPSKYSERLKHHEELYLNHRVIPVIMKAFGFSKVEARSFAEMIFSLRLGLVLNWMNEPQKSKTTRAKVMDTVRKKIFLQFKES